MKKKILFISHDASRTGATVAIFHFLKWLKANTNVSYEIIIKHRKSGAMLPLFQSLAPVTLFPDTLAGKLEALRSVFNRRGIRLPVCNLVKNLLQRRVHSKDFDLIYSNTVTNGEILKLLSKPNSPVICHVHELEWGITHYGLDRFKLTKCFTDRFVAVSNAVKENLIKNHNIPSGVVDINYEFIPTFQFDSIDVESARIRVCKENNIPENSVIICGSGTTGWRKGPDLFIQLAMNVHNLVKKNSVYFLWIGGQKNGAEYHNLSYDIKKLGLSSHIRFVPEQENPFDYFAASDLFAMVSREDPFPLVCLEAAALGKPVLCFDNAGGMKEFVETDAGFVVPYLDIIAMSQKCVEIIRSPDLRIRLGEKAKSKVRQRHDVEVAAPRLLQIIKKQLEKGGSTKCHTKPHQIL